MPRSGASRMGLLAMCVTAALLAAAAPASAAAPAGRRLSGLFESRGKQAFAYPAQANDTCTDVPPDNAYTCIQQTRFGKCNATYMTEGNYCSRTCGRDPCPPRDNINSAPPRVFALAAVPSACTDIPPRGSPLSCAEQRGYGKCNETWMVDGNHCARTCGRWPCVDACAGPHRSNGSVPRGCRDTPPPQSKYSCSEQANFGQCNALFMVRAAACARTCGFPPCPLIITADTTRAADATPEAPANATDDLGLNTTEPAPELPALADGPSAALPSATPQPATPAAPAAAVAAAPAEPLAPPSPAPFVMPPTVMPPVTTGGPEPPAAPAAPAADAVSPEAPPTPLAAAITPAPSPVGVQAAEPAAAPTPSPVGVQTNKPAAAPTPSPFAVQDTEPKATPSPVGVQAAEPTPAPTPSPIGVQQATQPAGAPTPSPIGVQQATQPAGAPTPSPVAVQDTEPTPAPSSSPVAVQATQPTAAPSPSPVVVLTTGPGAAPPPSPVAVLATVPANPPPASAAAAP